MSREETTILLDMRKIYRREVVFFDKIENFYQKKQLASKEPLPARLLSVAKNSALYALSSSMEGYFLKKQEKENGSRFLSYFCRKLNKK